MKCEKCGKKKCDFVERAAKAGKRCATHFCDPAGCHGFDCRPEGGTKKV